MENERKEKARKESNRAVELQRLYEKLQALGGLWTSSAAVDEGLEKLTTGKRGEQKLKLDALKTQISFRKKSLGQQIPAKLGCFSSNGKALSFEELAVKLKEIIAMM